MNSGSVPELEASGLAHPAATAVAAHQPSRVHRLAASPHADAVVRLRQVLHAHPAMDLHAQRRSARRKRRFDTGHGAGLALAERAWQAPGPARGVDPVVEELDPREVTTRSPTLLRPWRRRYGIAAARGPDDGVEQSAAVQRLERGDGQAADAERRLLER